MKNKVHTSAIFHIHISFFSTFIFRVVKLLQQPFTNLTRAGIEQKKLLLNNKKSQNNFHRIIRFYIKPLIFMQPN